MHKISIIIPAYNEQENLSHDCLLPIIEYIQSVNFSCEILLVNDGSSDNTLNYLKKFAQNYKFIKIINNSHMGKAASIISGVKNASGEIILFTDMDQATPITEFSKFIGRFDSGYDIVIGTLRTLILNLPFTDTQCGFKAFTKSSAHKIFPILERIHRPKSISVANTNPGFDLEILYIAKKLGFKIAQVAVLWHYVESKRVSFVKDAIGGLKELLAVRLRSLTNKYI